MRYSSEGNAQFIRQDITQAATLLLIVIALQSLNDITLRPSQNLHFRFIPVSSVPFLATSQYLIFHYTAELQQIENGTCARIFIGGSIVLCLLSRLCSQALGIGRESFPIRLASAMLAYQYQFPSLHA